MHTHPLKLVTIVGEAVLADALVAELRALGASGWTLSDARGEGSRQARSQPPHGDNFRLETVVGPELADQLLVRLATRWFPDYALAAWVADVQVVRGDKYR